LNLNADLDKHQTLMLLSEGASAFYLSFKDDFSSIPSNKVVL